MAVIDVKAKRSGNRAVTSGDANSQTYGRTKMWTVKCSSRDDDELDALGAPGLPRVGDMDGKRMCVDLAAERVGTSFMFEVTAEYRSLQTAGSGSATAASILDTPPRISWGRAGRTEQIDIDARGYPIVNTAGVPLNPPQSRDFQDRTITIGRYERSFNWLASDEWTDVVNADRFFGYPAGLVRCLGISATELYEGANRIYDVSYSFAVRYAKWAGQRHGWKRRVWNVGKVYWNDSEEVKLHVPIRDDEGNVIPEPVPLDPDGLLFNPNNLPAKTSKSKWGHECILDDSGRGIWVLYEVFPALRFSSLRLP